MVLDIYHIQCSLLWGFHISQCATSKAEYLAQEIGVLTLGDKKEDTIWLKHSMKAMNFLHKCLEKYVSVSSNTQKEK